jgi:hypothetical protein
LFIYIIIDRIYLFAIKFILINLWIEYINR